MFPYTLKTHIHTPKANVLSIIKTAHTNKFWLKTHFAIKDSIERNYKIIMIMIKYHDKSQATEDINIMRNKNNLQDKSRNKNKQNRQCKQWIQFILTHENWALRNLLFAPAKCESRGLSFSNLGAAILFPIRPEKPVFVVPFLSVKRVQIRIK